jgi:hypothetical protein
MWVPMDDGTTMIYSVDYQPGRPLQDAEMTLCRAWLHIHAENLPGSDFAVQNKGNDYMIDREKQKSGGSYTGMKGLSTQDCAIQESMGAIADRTMEHLGVSDTAIIQIRRLLLRALNDMAEGRAPPGLEAASYRARSTRFRRPRKDSFKQVVEAQLKAAAAK